MLYKISDKTKRILLALPETGIGYQIIQARIDKDKELQSFVVFNAEIAVENNKDVSFYSNTLIGYCYQMLLTSLPQTDLLNIKAIDSYEKQQEIFGMSMQSTENNDIKDIYIRPTIYENDHRVDSTKQVLLPGSCVTTEQCFVESHRKGKDPFQILALPDQEEFKNVYYVKYQNQKNRNNGFFKEAFGKRGGGLKLSFDDFGKVVRSGMMI